MTRILGLSVVAEGVEDHAQFAFLQRIGCDAVQGFYVSAAVPPEQFAQMLENADGTPRLFNRRRQAGASAS